MCLACEQDAIWLAYLESQGLLQPDDPAAVEALFAGFPVQPLPTLVQERLVLDVPATVTVNCCCAPVATWAVAGEMATDTGSFACADCANPYP